MRGIATSSYFSHDMVDSMVGARSPCSRCRMLSVSMSKVMAQATRAPFGQGTGLLIMVVVPSSHR